MGKAKSIHISRFNPLAWGILFFTLWLKLRTAEELNTSQETISWAFLAVSVILFLSIVIPPLARIMSTKTAEQILIPTVFFLSIFSLIFAWAGDLKDMYEKSITGLEIPVGVIFGFLWLIAYLMILTHSISIHSRYFGIAFSAVYAIIGIYVIFTEPNKWGGVILIIIGAILCLVATKILKINYPPIFGDGLED
jgi:hypothetical protein